MKNKTYVYFLLFVSIVLSCSQEKEPWVSLFDGKSLEHWEIRNGTADFQIIDSEIVDIHAHADTNLNYSAEIQKLVEQLNPKYREAFVLTKLSGRSIKETAKELKISESAAKVRVHRASKEIRKLIEDSFESYS